jgi:hypothetical protein
MVGKASNHQDERNGPDMHQAVLDMTCGYRIPDNITDPGDAYAPARCDRFGAVYRP